MAARKDGPFGEDLISLIVRGDIDGEPLSPDEMMSYVALLLFGGLHTTTHAIAGFLVWLAQHPEHREVLRSDPTVFPAAIEESLRYTSPSTHIARTSTKSTEVRGCPIPEGSRIMVGIGAANFDPRKFATPSRWCSTAHPTPMPPSGSDRTAASVRTSPSCRSGWPLRSSSNVLMASRWSISARCDTPVRKFADSRPCRYASPAKRRSK